MVLTAGQHLAGSDQPAICRHHGDASKGQSTQAARLPAPLALFLSTLLITRCLCDTRPTDTGLRNRYACGCRGCLPFRACTGWEEQRTIDAEGERRCRAGREARRRQRAHVAFPDTAATPARAAATAVLPPAASRGWDKPPTPPAALSGERRSPWQPALFPSSWVETHI